MNFENKDIHELDTLNMKSQIASLYKQIEESLEIADKPFWDLKFEDFTLKNYEHHPVIKFPVAV